MTNIPAIFWIRIINIMDSLNGRPISLQIVNLSKYGRKWGNWNSVWYMRRHQSEIIINNPIIYCYVTRNVSLLLTKVIGVKYELPLVLVPRIFAYVFPTNFTRVVQAVPFLLTNTVFLFLSIFTLIRLENSSLIRKQSVTM